MRLAVITASGIGDALILHTLSHAARLKGWEATTFSTHLASFGPWLPSGSSVAPQPSPEENFSGFNAIFLQHDNSQKAFRIKAIKRIPVYTFYGAYTQSKHGPLDETFDFIADRNQSMVANIETAGLKFFGCKPESINRGGKQVATIDSARQSQIEAGLPAVFARKNILEYEGFRAKIDMAKPQQVDCQLFTAPVNKGFLPPPGLIYRRFSKRIAIHPTASSNEKIWPKEKFLRVAAWLKQEGYDPVFTVSPSEAPEWNSPLFPTLGDLASFLYESGAFLGNDSGTAHLASLLEIPHLVIAGNGLQMPLWRTGWLPGHLIAPPAWLMQFKYLREKWKLLISKRTVIKKFKESVLRN